MPKKDYNYKIKGKGKLTEYNSSFDSKTVEWEAEKGMVRSDPLHDEGVGKAIILRSFEYKFPPGPHAIPTKEQILTKEYVKHLKVLLWADELEMIMEPRMTINDRGFFIFVTCQAKKGSLLPYNVKTKRLQDITNGQNNQTNS